MERKTVVVSLMTVLFLTSVAALGASGDKAKAKGMITTRTGETLIVKSADRNTTVVLTDDTKTQDRRGLFGLEKQPLSSVVLIPGLKVSVDGTLDDQGRIVAKTITADGDDLETAEMIQAGLNPTAEKVAANMQAIETNQQGVAANKAQLASQKENIETNQQNVAVNKQQIEQNIKDIDENTRRFTALSDYDGKGEATGGFLVGRSPLSGEGEKDHNRLAQAATGLTG